MARAVEDERQAHRAASKELRRTRRAQDIVQQVAADVQKRAHDRIAGIVTLCLRAVFREQAYEFRVLFEKKRGKTEARMVFFRDGVEYDPRRDVGGGVVDVAAFALRLACIMVSRPTPRRLLVLDEPFRFVSRRADYRDRVAALLLRLADEMGVQFLIVTHDTELEVGKVVRLGG